MLKLCGPRGVLTARAQPTLRSTFPIVRTELLHLEGFCPIFIVLVVAAAAAVVAVAAVVVVAAAAVVVAAAVAVEVTVISIMEFYHMLTRW